VPNGEQHPHEYSEEYVGWSKDITTLDSDYIITGLTYKGDIEYRMGAKYDMQKVKFFDESIMEELK